MPATETDINDTTDRSGVFAGTWVIGVQDPSAATGGKVTFDEAIAICNGDHLDISFNPTNYTPDSSISEADDVDDAAAHLKGIDTKLGTIAAGGMFSTISETTAASYTLAAGEFLITNRTDATGVTVTLPASPADGTICGIKRRSAGSTYTLQGDGGTNIDGSGTVSGGVDKDFHIVIFADSEWQIISKA